MGQYHDIRKGLTIDPWAFLLFHQKKSYFFPYKMTSLAGQQVIQTCLIKAVFQLDLSVCLKSDVFPLSPVPQERFVSFCALFF